MTEGGGSRGKVEGKERSTLFTVVPSRKKKSEGGEGGGGGSCLHFLAN